MLELEIGESIPSDEEDKGPTVKEEMEDWWDGRQEWALGVEKKKKSAGYEDFIDIVDRLMKVKRRRRRKC